MVEVEECKHSRDHASRRMLFLHNRSSTEGSHPLSHKSKRNSNTGTLKKNHGTVRDWSSPFGQVVRKSWRLGPISLKKREKKTGGEKKVGAKYFPRSSLCLHLQIFYPLSPSPKTKASAKLWIISLFSSSENRKTFNM